MFLKFCGFLLVTLVGGIRDVHAIDCNKGPPVMPDLCCRSPMMFKPNAFEMCSAEFKTMNCIAECIMEDSGVLVNQKIDLDYMIYCAHTNLKDNKQQFWMEPVEKVMRYCVPKAWKVGDSLVKKDEEGCLKLPGYLMGCMMMQFVTNCPESEWLGAPGCDDLKVFVDKC